MTQEETRLLSIELAGLDPSKLAERLLREPLLERLYWYAALSRGHFSEAEYKRLAQGATDDELTDAQIVLAKVNIAAQRAARRHYRYDGDEPRSEEAIQTEMIAHAVECPSHILFHAYERALFEYR